MAMRQATENLQGVFGGNKRVPMQNAAPRFELGGWPMREIRQGAGFDWTGLPLACAQEDGWRCGAIGERCAIQALKIRK